VSVRQVTAIEDEGSSVRFNIILSGNFDGEFDWAKTCNIFTNPPITLIKTTLIIFIFILLRFN